MSPHLPAPPALRRPNILLIVADDHRHDCVGAAGHASVRTPHLDGLAAGGIRFARAQIIGGDNPAVCVPSRAALFTGCAPCRAIMPAATPSGRSAAIMPDRPLLGEGLRTGGYQTFITGKWHNCRASLNRSFSAGANIFLGGMSSHTAVPVFDYDPTGAYAPDQARVARGFSSEVFADSAINFIHRHDPDRPFFACLAFTSPHDPRTPPRQYRDLYDEAALPLPQNFLPEHPFDNGELDVRDERLAARPRDPAEIRRHLADYYGMISHQDAQIGRVLAALRDGGLLDSTIVVYTADHGLALGQHGLMGKQNLYEHSLRVPLILRGPGVPVGRRIDDPVYSFDLMPTLCELGGVPAPAGLDGHSLRPWFDSTAPGGADTRQATLFAYYRACQRMVQDGRWKLIEYRVGGRRRQQLFDLASDPHEIRDLTGTPDFPRHHERLSAALEDWENRLGLSRLTPV